VSNYFRAVNKLQKMQRNGFDKLKLPGPIVLPKTKNPLPVSRRGLYDIGDDVCVPLICPTRQALCDLVRSIPVCASTFKRNH
jgi:hypothetical protein